jgi:hypothetical protein
MSDKKDIEDTVRQERRREQSGKYKPLPRNAQTERELKKIFDLGTELELVKYLEEQGLPDGSEQSARIVKLFREHGAKRR